MVEFSAPEFSMVAFSAGETFHLDYRISRKNYLFMGFSGILEKKMKIKQRTSLFSNKSSLKIIS